MKIDLNIKQKTCLASGLLIIVIVLLVSLIVNPLLKEIKETSSLVKTNQEKLLLLKGADHKYLEQLKKEYEEIKNDILLVNSSFLEINQVVDFIMELEDFASTSSNRLEIKKVDYPAFNFQLIGSFSNLMRYLGWLENSKYFINIKSIQIGRVGERIFLFEGEPVLSGSVRSILEVESQFKPLNYE